MWTPFRPRLRKDRSRSVQIRTRVPRLEPLEPRLALATVTTTADSGPGSLRDAIEQANANFGEDLITTMIGGDSQRIVLLSALPPITERIRIEGLSTTNGQKMVINGSNVSAFANGLQIEASSSLVRNVVVEDFPATGIFLIGTQSVTVEENVLRRNGNAVLRTDAGGAGVAIKPTSAGGGLFNTVRFNTITENTFGIGLGEGARSNTIHDNTISDSLFDGVFVYADADGEQLASTSFNDLERNIITRNANGIALYGSVEFPVGSGVNLGVTNNMIQDNTITANRESGVLIDGFHATTNTVRNNTISANLGHGVRISGAADGNIVGGPSLSYQNVIHGNHGDGVMVQELGYNFFPGYESYYQANGPALNNSIRGNDILGNWGLPIDLNEDGITVNDLGDLDSGPNNSQNYPEIAVARAGSKTFVSGTLNSLASTNYTLDFYASSAAGQRWLGSAVRATDGSGNVAFEVLLTQSAMTVAGEVVMATATDSAGNTSEFSAPVTVTDFVVTGTAADDTHVLSAHVTGAVEAFLNGVSQGVAAQVLISDPDGSDTYNIDFGGWTGNVTLNDLGTSSADTVNFNGTAAADQFEKQFTFVEWNLEASPFAKSRVDYAGIETKNVFGSDGNDTIHDPGEDTFLFGGSGDDTIVIDATSGSGVVVDGGEGADTYVVQFGNLAGPVTVADSGTSGTDSLTVQGTAGDDAIALSGNEVQRGAERVIIAAPVEGLTVNAGDGSDTMSVVDFTAPILSLGLDGGAGTNQVSVEGGLPPGVVLDIVGATQTVQIDVLRDTLNLASNGIIAVAVVTTANFDAAMVNANSVIFAGAHAVRSSLDDVDGDGDLDMVLHFRAAETILRAVYEQLLADDINADGVLDSNHQRAAVSLTAQTVDEVLLEGFDELDLLLAGKSLRQLLDQLAAAGAI